MTHRTLGTAHTTLLVSSRTHIPECTFLLLSFVRHHVLILLVCLCSQQRLTGAARLFAILFLRVPSSPRVATPATTECRSHPGEMFGVPLL